MPVGFAVEKFGERCVVDAVSVALDIADERRVGISPSADGVEVAGWPREHRRCGVGGLFPGKDILIDWVPPAVSSMDRLVTSQPFGRSGS